MKSLVPALFLLIAMGVSWRDPWSTLCGVRRIWISLALMGFSYLLIAEIYREAL